MGYDTNLGLLTDRAASPMIPRHPVRMSASDGSASGHPPTGSSGAGGYGPEKTGRHPPDGYSGSFRVATIRVLVTPRLYGRTCGRRRVARGPQRRAAAG